MTPKKDSEFHRPVTPVAPRKPRPALATKADFEECVQRIEDLERKPAPAPPTFEELFLDRSDAAVVMLERFVSDQLPDPPNNSLKNWGITGILVGLIVASSLVGNYQRERMDGLQWQVTDTANRVAQQAAAIAQLRESEPLKSDRAAIVKFDGNNITVSSAAIVLDLDQRCWVQATGADGKVAFAGYLPAGRALAGPAVMLPVTVRDGCPGHVAFTVDGAPVDPPREPGHAQNRVEVVTLGRPTVKPQSYIYAVPEERKPCSGRCA